ncbi:hypothetical protein BpHYR1_021427 [Brachionus plicatilis]|uniref:Uncharacterized protein n=1 Tax=Brachionus plicatilis TaxID=10195 RepID=A0A3M7PTS2_BRAPC|nr:hypothetical protein BpHYR1_021427 [Brachionus plicatilis]
MLILFKYFNLKMRDHNKPPLFYYNLKILIKSKLFTKRFSNLLVKYDKECLINRRLNAALILSLLVLTKQFNLQIYEYTFMQFLK